MRFSRTEIRDLLLAWFAVSLAFAFAQGLNAGIIIMFPVAAIAVGLGFLLHELAHKFVAQRYHAWAEFRADKRMLGMMLIVSLFGLIFAAPGAVWIHGITDYRRNGKIALAGPAMNILLSGLFLALSLTPLSFFAFYGAQINAWLAVFNLIPFASFDGAKVLAWNRYVWAGAGLLALGLLFLTFI
jgi:Zn-dependent protease